MNILKRRGALIKIEPRCSAMSSETKNFIQKICYRKSASIDMTQYGFIQDSKVRPINLMVKPLQQQLDRIWGKNSRTSKTSRTVTKNSVRKPSPSRRSEKASRIDTKSRKPATHVEKTVKLVKKDNKNNILNVIKSNVREKRKH